MDMMVFRGAYVPYSRKYSPSILYSILTIIGEAGPSSSQGIKFLLHRSKLSRLRFLPLLNTNFSLRPKESFRRNNNIILILQFPNKQYLTRLANKERSISRIRNASTDKHNPEK